MGHIFILEELFQTQTKQSNGRTSLSHAEREREKKLPIVIVEKELIEMITFRFEGGHQSVLQPLIARIFFHGRKTGLGFFF